MLKNTALGNRGARFRVYGFYIDRTPPGIPLPDWPAFNIGQVVSFKWKDPRGEWPDLNVEIGTAPGLADRFTGTIRGSLFGHSLAVPASEGEASTVAIQALAASPGAFLMTLVHVFPPSRVTCPGPSFAPVQITPGARGDSRIA